MFKFEFLDNQCNQSNNEHNNIAWAKSQEITLNDCNLQLGNLYSDDSNINLFTYGVNKNIRHVLSSSVMNAMLQHKETNEWDIFRAEREHSDLLTGIYEGGFKIWECTKDLANYIDSQELCFRNAKVLDLGCGAGILGIIAVKNGASCYFQDYNSEVLKYIAIPNVILNLELNVEDRRLYNCKFYSGDWQSFLDITERDFQNDSNKFDYIFTSETIYNPSNYRKLHDVFKHRLNKNGVVYLAAKSHYFGVGGGIHQFQDLINREDVFNCSSCWRCTAGVQREILRLSFKK